jgi:hypothetical protein
VSFLSKPKYLSLTLLAALTSCCSTPAPAPRIDVAKMEPSQIMTGPYSFYVPPYSYYYFHHMDELGFRLDWIRRAGPVYELRAPAAPFTVSYTYQGRAYALEDYYQRNSVLGFMVLKDNQIITESYFHGSDQNSRFLSMSVQKSMTSTLFGIAYEEGKIASLDDPVTKYLPDLSSSGYNRVNLREVLEMATGIDASEQPLDPHSSIHQFTAMTVSGVPSFSDYLKSLQAKPDVEPGTVFDYETVNTEVLGLVIEKATGQRLNEYMQEKIWGKIGAQSDAFLFRAQAQPDQGAYGSFCCTLRDYGRFGLMMMNGGTLGGVHVVGSDWVREATSPRPYPAQPPASGGYGYQWWIPANSDGAYQATGIYGQLIYINPARHIVIVENSAWPQPDTDARWDEMDQVIAAIVAKLSP